jgi:hypothetical protein
LLPGVRETENGSSGNQAMSAADQFIEVTATTTGPVTPLGAPVALEAGGSTNNATIDPAAATASPRCWASGSVAS